MVPSDPGHRRRSVLAGAALAALSGCSSLRDVVAGRAVAVREVEILNYDDEPHTGDFSVENGSTALFERSFDLAAKVETEGRTDADAAVFDELDPTGRELTVAVSAGEAERRTVLTQDGPVRVLVVITEDGAPVFRIESLG